MIATRSDYQFKTAPMAHQLRMFENSKDLFYWGNLSEQGTGKTKVFIDTACYLYNQGKIDAVLVIAPNGVQSNWAIHELPTHFPDHTRYHAAVFTSAPRKADKVALDKCWSKDNGLVFLCVNVEALSHKKQYEYMRKFVNAMRVMLIIDESHTIKTPGVNRTRAALRLAMHCPYRRISTGTPATENPLAFYTQMRVLDKNILGFDNFTSFKNHYAIQEERLNRRTNRAYKEIMGWKNLDELMRLVNKHSMRYLKKECIDLPDKVYVPRPVDLSPPQKKLYNEIINQIKIEVNGQQITNELVMTRLMRAQQVTGGYLLDEHGNVHTIDGVNPKMEALADIAEDATGKIIVMCRFRAEIFGIVEMLEGRFGKGSTVQYHGGIAKSARPEVTRRFQEDDNVRFIVAQVKSAVGVTWTAATTVVYYSNEFSLLTRLQSEDRAHRIGQTNKVTYFDLYAQGTVDERVLGALRGKKEFSEVLLEDPITTWLKL